MEKKIISNWTGSETTENLVRRQILARWGEAEAGRYDPRANCLTIGQWNKNGFRVRKGETAVKSFVVVEKKNQKGEVVKKYPKQINLFYHVQVEQSAS
jgi:hypothetical protein